MDIRGYMITIVIREVLNKSKIPKEIEEKIYKNIMVKIRGESNEKVH